MEAMLGSLNELACSVNTALGLLTGFDVVLSKDSDFENVHALNQ